MKPFKSPIIAHEKRSARLKAPLEIEDQQKQTTIDKMVIHLNHACYSHDAHDLLEAIIAGRVPGLTYTPKYEEAENA